MKKGIISLLSALIFISTGGRILAQGLEFRSMNYEIDSRTSLEVFASGKTPQFRNYLEISFDMMTRPSSRFGYIFRLCNEEQPAHFWNLSYDGRGTKVVIRLNDEGFRSAICAEIPKDSIPHYRWMPVRVLFDARKDSVVLQIGGRHYSQEVPLEEENFRPSLFFGVNRHVVEVPSFAIRNLQVGNSERRFRFPMNETSGQKVHDTDGKARGTVINPTWITDESYRWRHVATINAEVPGGPFLNQDTHEIGLYTEKGLQIFNLETLESYSREYATPCPMKLLSGTSFMSNGVLTAYEPSDWHEGPGKPSVASLDMDSLEWKALSTERLDGPMHHHAAFVNPHTGLGTFYGGYGDMFYNGDFYTFNPDGHWQKTPADREHDPELHPRFFCSAGVSPDSSYAYIFGGMGNETGEEVVGRRYFYDLHRYDLRTGECRHMWTVDWTGEPSVPARGLIVTEDCFYVLFYPEYLTTTTLQLYRFNLADGSFRQVGTGIQANSDKVWCNSQLYYDETIGKLIAINIDRDRTLVPRMEVYTLLFPPVETVPSPAKIHIGLWLPILLGVILLCTGAAWLLWRIRRKKKRRAENDRYVLSQSDSSKKVFQSAPRPNSICILGEFSATDREGRNVTGQFPPQTRLLLLLLIQHADSGISASQLGALLWPDKDSAKARNSRCAAINTLRKALSGMDGISVAFVDHNYRIMVQDDFQIDYLDFLRYRNDGDSSQALKLLSRGRFVPDNTDPLLDSFKSGAEDIIVPFLQEEMSSRMARGQWRAVIEIADMAFAYDPQDEQALKFSVSALMALGRRDDALLRYSLFQSEWQKLNGEPYPIKFSALHGG